MTGHEFTFLAMLKVLFPADGHALIGDMASQNVEGGAGEQIPVFKLDLKLNGVDLELPESDYVVILLRPLKQLMANLVPKTFSFVLCSRCELRGPRTDEPYD